MFETAEVGHKVTKEEFVQAELDLRSKLLDVQRRIRDAGFQTIIVGWLIELTAMPSTTFVTIASSS